MAIDGSVARLRVDGVVHVQALEGAVDDCTSTDNTRQCTLHIGQRAGGYVLRDGCIYAAMLYRSQAL